jgi:HEPN domain-containing protein
MPDSRYAAWLKKAESDLLAADNNLAAARIPLDVVCFHCQQAAEKLLKGLLVFLGGETPRVHDLLALLDQIGSLLTSAIPEAVRAACVVLNPYAIEIRYPDDTWSPTLEDAREARDMAQKVRDWVVSIVGSRS